MYRLLLYKQTQSTRCLQFEHDYLKIDLLFIYFFFCFSFVIMLEFDWIKSRCVCFLKKKKQNFTINWLQAQIKELEIRANTEKMKSKLTPKVQAGVFALFWSHSLPIWIKSSNNKITLICIHHDYCNAVVDSMSASMMMIVIIVKTNRWARLFS